MGFITQGKHFYMLIQLALKTCSSVPVLLIAIICFQGSKFIDCVQGKSEDWNESIVSAEAMWIHPGALVLLQ